MIEGLKRNQPVDTIEGGANATLGDHDVMIDVEGFYFDHPENSQQEFPTKNVEEVAPPTDLMPLYHLQLPWI